MYMTRTLIAFIAGTMLAGAATSGVAERKSLTLDGARAVIAAIKAEALKNNATGAIAVVDEGGNLLALERLDGTFAAGGNISIGKARTAALFKKQTKFFEEIIAKGRTAMVTLPDFTPLQGGVPIEIDGQIVGAVGVSGASSAQQDQEFAAIGAAALNGRQPKTVTMFDASEVKAAFEKGAVLFNNGERYMVHASRREGPGMVEVHEDDADIVYVLDGTATLVTGGTPVEPKLTGPGEIRAASVNGGDARRIAKGDVVVIPAGTPHWFREVSGPLTYYVVKVR